MELKDRKFIKNTKNLLGFAYGASGAPDFSKEQDRINAVRDLYAPKPDTYTGQQLETAKNNYAAGMARNVEQRHQSDSAAVGAGPWFAIGSWLGGGVLEGLNSLKGTDELISDAGSGTSSIGGILYKTQNEVDYGNVMSEYDRSTATDFLTNPARGIAKIFSRGKQKDAAKEAAQASYRINTYNRGSALSDYLNLLLGLRYGDTKQLTLFAAKDGKPAYSPYGPVNGPANARVSNGETIVSPDGASYVVPGKPNNNDTKLAQVEDEDTILSNHGASQYYQLTGDLEGALLMDKQHRYSKGIGYKNGKLPKFAEGWWGNFIPNAINSLASLGLIVQAGRQKPYKPNTYVGNRYANNALNTLSSLRVNPYGIYPTIWDAYGRATSSIDRSGGLSSGLRAAAKIAAMSQTQGNIANMLTQNQVQNNTYKANWAQQALSAGAHDAQNRMAANQFDESYFAKSHAARQQGLQMGLYNLINSVHNYYANDFKRRQFNDTMDLYRSLNKLDWNMYYKSLI